MSDIKPFISQSFSSGFLGTEWFPGIIQATSLENDGLQNAMTMSNRVYSHFRRDSKRHIIGCEASQAESGATYLPIWKLWANDANDGQPLEWARREEILSKDRESGFFEMSDNWITCLCGRKSRSGTILSFFAHYYLEHIIEVNNPFGEPRTENSEPYDEVDDRGSDGASMAKNPSSAPEIPANCDHVQPEDSDGETEVDFPPEELHRKAPELHRRKSGKSDKDRRAALQALPHVGRIEPGVAECTVCEVTVQLGKKSFGSYNFERHLKSKRHLDALKCDKTRTRNDAVGGVRRSRASNSRQARRRVQKSNPLARTSNHPGGGEKTKRDAGTTNTAQLSSLLPEQPQPNEAEAPTADTVEFQAGGSARVEGTISVDGHRRKVIECTLSEGFAPKKMEISLTF
ncbi:hypothetical protein SCHPADRAFT_907669 [Schizopora paradoxa]|uniref:Uncharacterized protein n=1 Tax=Schizopora paradoxa TaxID=27342 RepID=A0A0H2RDH0_9AGAM|nr:hypothetical protein SCHPADRAFT_907669 [Schizopora paradoxa]